MSATAEAAQLSRYKRAATITNSKHWPVKVKCRFIEPGLVNYDDLGLGMILVQRPFLNKVQKSFEGKPVIDEQHKDATPQNFEEIADGMVSNVWTDPVDGWDWCEFYVWDEETLRHAKDPTYRVSCAYNPTKIDQKGGKYHNVEYDGEFLDGEYTHLAIVKDPRYEGANIVWNSVGGKVMKNIFKLFRAPETEEVAELDGAKTFIEVDGERVTIENAVKIVQEHTKAGKTVEMKDSDMILIDGKNWTVAEIKNAMKEAKAAKNAKHDHDGGMDNCGKGCPAYNSKDGEGKAEEEEDKEGKKRVSEKEEKEMEKGIKNSLASISSLGLSKEETVKVINSLAAKPEHQKPEAQAIFKEALNAIGVKEEPNYLKEFEKLTMENNNPDMPQISTMADRLELGLKRYGKKIQEVK